MENATQRGNTGTAQVGSVASMRRTAEDNRIRSAPHPSSYAKKYVREAIEALAREPDISTLIEHGDHGSIIWPTTRTQAQVHGAERTLAFHAIDVVGLLAFFLKPTVISALDALVDAEKDDDAALDFADRARRESEALGDILEQDRIEAEMVFAAWAQGLPAEHRADCSPLALLGLRLVTTARASEVPSTSPGLSWPWRR